MALNEFDIFKQKTIPFNYYLTSNNERVIRLANNLLERLELGNKKIELKRSFLITFLLNMKIAKESNKYITISRDQNTYLGPDRYKKPNRSYRINISVLDKMKKMNFIDHVRGVKYKGKPGLQTKIVPKPALNALMFFVDYDVIDLVRPKELIVLKNKDDVKTDYSDTKKTNKLRGDLAKYNDLRENTKLELKNIEWEIYKKFEKRIVILIKDKLRNIEKGKPVSVILRKSYVHRSFKIDFVLGGRFYGGVETWMNKELRKYIYIVGRKTVELDYNGLHLRILYNKNKLACSDDPYTIMDKQSAALRDIYKIASLRMLNAISKKKAVYAIRNELKGTDFRKAIPNLSDLTLNKLCDDFVKAHPAMEKHFYSGVGLILQYEDSKVAEEIVNHFTNKGILVLVIHDSFIIDRRYRDELYEMMTSFYEKRFKFTPKIKEK